MENNSEIRLEYKGFVGICKSNEKDNGRLYGQIYSPEKPSVALDDWAFAADSIREAKEEFKIQVNEILGHCGFEKEQKKWLKTIDAESVRCVFNILPDEFRKRIELEQFDKNLLTSVKGGDYEVPLYYVTKAWDILLKRSLGMIAFKIGPEEDYDPEFGYENDLRVFMREEMATRTRPEACQQNEEMKTIWKEKFDIDIDALNIDFSQFNMHIPPNVGESKFEKYFEDVPNGVSEWILYGINHPDCRCTFHAVSCLMEFVALVETGNYDLDYPPTDYSDPSLFQKE